MNTSEVGAWAEHEAQGYLEARGLKLVRRNYRCKFGEIDLVMMDGDIVAFVEVRYRANTKFGAGFETVSYTKQRRLITAAGSFLSRHRRFSRRCCRFDVVSVTGGNCNLHFLWIRDAFQKP
ncbi:MAG: YraN family protein [Gammaproteobacteria bacterium]|nr:YraN family protein [Gammaproteobacteria bacterium]MCZ6856354.1 YraN family protein [Gammaproteobacteria bacterium]